MNSSDISYAYLAAAIVEHGIKENDKNFLNSVWCNDLKAMVVMAADSISRKSPCKNCLSTRRSITWD